MAWTASTTQLAMLIPLAVASAGIIYCFFRDRIERKGYPLPPGPTALPLLGSALSINFKEPYRTYTEWKETYGDIIYVRILDMDVVVLNTPSASNALLDKRSRIYSDRPFLTTREPFGHNCNFSLARYGGRWRLCRRIFHQTFRADTVDIFHPIQLRAARQLVLNVMDDSNDFASYFSTFGAAVTMRSIYNYHPSAKNDRMVSGIYSFLEATVTAMLPEKAALFKYFPFLLHIPDWLPGSHFKHEARKARELGARMVEEPYQYARKQMKSDRNANPSMVSDHITRMEKFDEPYCSEYEIALKHTAVSAFMGSVETTASTLMTFVLAMVKNPRVWKRAQAEIDAIVGINRLPEFDDRSSLPYVDAIIRESLRWQPTVPLAPHATTSSDIYNGYYIPKGAIVFGNIWAITRDEDRYPNAVEFIPERFLNAEGMLTEDSVEYVFGFGRRVCPGRYTADGSLWIAVATMLATFDFHYTKDTEGNDITFEAKFLNGLTRHPLTFPCQISPRSHIKRAYLEQTFA